MLCFYPDHFIYTDNEKMGDSKTHLSGSKFNMFFTTLIRGTFYPSYRQTWDENISVEGEVETTEEIETDRTIHNDTNLNAEQTETRKSV